MERLVVVVMVVVEMAVVVEVRRRKRKEEEDAGGDMGIMVCWCYIWCLMTQNYHNFSTY